MNWGKGIIIALALFIGFILYMVIQMAQKQTDLVEPDFYEKQMDIDNRVLATENAIVYEEDFVISQDVDNISIAFPKELEMEKAKGLIHFYRPENAKLDRKFPVAVVNFEQFFPKKDLTAGNFRIKMEFKIGPTRYYIEKKVSVKK